LKKKFLNTKKTEEQEGVFLLEQKEIPIFLRPQKSLLFSHERESQTEQNRIEYRVEEKSRREEE